MTWPLDGPSSGRRTRRTPQPAQLPAPGVSCPSLAPDLRASEFGEWAGWGGGKKRSSRRSRRSWNAESSSSKPWALPGTLASEKPSPRSSRKALPGRPHPGDLVTLILRPPRSWAAGRRGFLQCREQRRAPVTTVTRSHAETQEAGRGEGSGSEDRPVTQDGRPGLPFRARAFSTGRWPQRTALRCVVPNTPWRGPLVMAPRERSPCRVAGHQAVLGDGLGWMSRPSYLLGPASCPPFLLQEVRLVSRVAAALKSAFSPRSPCAWS